jgi:hypothetical protein
MRRQSVAKLATAAATVLAAVSSSTSTSNASRLANLSGINASLDELSVLERVQYYYGGRLT